MEFFKYVKQEIAVIKDRDPAIKSTMEVFLYPSFHAILKYRKAHKLYLKSTITVHAAFRRKRQERPVSRFIRVPRLVKVCLSTTDMVWLLVKQPLSGIM